MFIINKDAIPHTPGHPLPVFMHADCRHLVSVLFHAARDSVGRCGVHRQMDAHRDVSAHLFRHLGGIPAPSPPCGVVQGADVGMGGAHRDERCYRGLASHLHGRTSQWGMARLCRQRNRSHVGAAYRNSSGTEPRQMTYGITRKFLLVKRPSRVTSMPMKSGFSKDSSSLPNSTSAITKPSLSP